MSQTLDELRTQFRAELEAFYAALGLAPPYDTVERAVTAFMAAIKAMEPPEQRRLTSDIALRRASYQKAFVAGGLHEKHRGIIRGLIRAQHAATLEERYRPFVEVFGPASGGGA